MSMGSKRLGTNFDLITFCSFIMEAVSCLSISEVKKLMRLIRLTLRDAKKKPPDKKNRKNEHFKEIDGDGMIHKILFSEFNIKVSVSQR